MSRKCLYEKVLCRPFTYLEYFYTCNLFASPLYFGHSIVFLAASRAT